MCNQSCRRRFVEGYSFYRSTKFSYPKLRCYRPFRERDNWARYNRGDFRFGQSLHFVEFYADEWQIDTIYLIGHNCLA